MAAVAAALLIIVVVAVAVLAAVGVWHHTATSPRARQKLRRWRYLVRWWWEDWRDEALHVARVWRRALAERLSRPRPARTPARSQ